MNELVPIPLNRLLESQNLWLPFVASVAKRQRCYVEQRLADVYSGNVAITLVWDAEKKRPRALLGHSILQRGPDSVFKLVWAVGVDRHHWTWLYDELEKCARQAGCAGGAALARPGWGPELKKWGYRMAHVEYEKDF